MAAARFEEPFNKLVQREFPVFFGQGRSIEGAGIRVEDGVGNLIHIPCRFSPGQVPTFGIRKEVARHNAREILNQFTEKGYEARVTDVSRPSSAEASHIAISLTVASPPRQRAESARVLLGVDGKTAPTLDALLAHERIDWPNGPEAD